MVLDNNKPITHFHYSYATVSRPVGTAGPCVQQAREYSRPGRHPYGNCDACRISCNSTHPMSKIIVEVKGHNCTTGDRYLLNLLHHCEMRLWIGSRSRNMGLAVKKEERWESKDRVEKRKRREK